MHLDIPTGKYVFSLQLKQIFSVVVYVSLKQLPIHQYILIYSKQKETLWYCALQTQINRSIRTARSLAKIKFELHHITFSIALS